MLNDRKDKYEGNQPEEEGEYHFSEDEVNYEVESEPTKPPVASGLKENVLNRLSSSKRMIIGLVAFIILIFVVYKVLTPAGPSTPSMDISTVPTAQTPAGTMTTQPPAVVTAPIVTAPNQAITPPTQLAPPIQPVTTPQIPPPAGVQAQTGMPVVIPVTTPTAVYPNKEIASEPTSGVELRMATMAANNEKLIMQMQTEYTQRINDFAAQNKALQDQMQSLSTRLATMESQMSQLMQVLTRTNQTAAPVSPPSQPEIKIPYNVQAIIPGRAWLRSDSGETITVAEGDIVKGVGRVTKIDPYDGIVEINTGTKTVSLSYGTGG